MAIEACLQMIPGLTASEDLSAKQYFFVGLSGNFAVSLVDSATAEWPLGVLQDAPKSGAVATVAFAGITKVVLGGTVVATDYVGPDANGAAVAYVAGSATSNWVRGQMLEGGSAGEIRSMMLVSAHRAS
jgi:hypothetical protein